MDEQTGTALQQLVDLRLGGHLQDRVEALRKDERGWRKVAAAISEEAGLSVGYETLRNWARAGEWNVWDDADDSARLGAA